MNQKVVTICGSMKFALNMQNIARDLEIKYGWAIIQCVYNSQNYIETEEHIQNLIKAHYKKIDISDAIYVVNIGGYIGNQTKKEIDYAISLGKQVIYHENLN